MNETIEILVIVMVLFGTLLSLLSSIGFIRLPDVFTRSHAATKSITLGTLTILLAAFIYFWYFHNLISIRLLLGIAFVFLTAPVAGHLIARSAHRFGVKLADVSVKDELHDDLKKLEQEQLLQEQQEEQQQNKEQLHNEQLQQQAKARDTQS